jgi:ABC-type polysaccharide/polyol phosphate export permease
LTTAIDRTVWVDSRRPRLADRLRELWAYRDLVRNLILRDLKVRYKNSLLGFLWSLLSPLLMMTVFWLVFSFIMDQRIRDYAVFILVALLPWNWFQVATAAGVGSITANAALINKVYFPREALPLSVVGSELVNFLLAMPVLGVMLYATGNPLTAHALWLPVIIAIQFVFTLGIVLLLSTANVYYRDTAVILEVALLAWFFLTPIIYDFDAATGVTRHVAGIEVSGARIAYIVNPMASLISSYRVVLYGSAQGPPAEPAYDFLLRTAFTGLVALGAGYWFFSRHAGRFGEEV